MAQLVVSAVGAGVGFLVGGAAGAKVGWIAGSLLGAFALTETQKQEGPRLNDLKITGTDYGEPLPWVQGSPRIAGQIIWASERREHKHTESQGKGGGAESTSYTYTCDLMILLSENPIAGVARVWANNEVVFAKGDAKDGFWREMRVYNGAADQLPDPLYEAAVGVGNAPAYRGHGYVVIENLDLGGSGNIPNLTFELGESVTSENITCIAVIDENDTEDTQSAVNAKWADFSERFPKRRMIVLRPTHAFLPLYTPEDPGPNFIGPIAVARDEGNVALRSNWYDLCSLDTLPMHSSIALFIDNSGSMTTGTVQASYDYFMQRLQERGIGVVTVENGDEDYITPFNRYLDIPGGSNVISQDLEGVTSSLMYRAGYAAADFDAVPLRDLDKPLRALTLSQTANTRSALEVLQKGWFFECSATDKLTLRPRAVAPVVRIPFADLGFGNESDGADEPLALKIGNDLEQPAQLALTYANMAADYNADTQFSDRLVTGQASTETLQVPLGMLPTEAKAVVDALLFDMAASMHSTTLSVPLRYAYLEPGDVIEAVALDGRVLRLRITTRKDQQMFLELECVLDDVGALESAAITDTGYISVSEPTRVPGTVWEAMDIPILRDADNASGFYLAAAPESINYATDQWRGAVAAASWDGVDYAHLQTLLDAAVLGSCTTVLPAWAGGPVFDEASTLTVRVWGQLPSSTRESMLLDDTVNALLVGAEIVRFRNAELLVSDVPANIYAYRLSGFLRGQRGTEWAVAGHVANERCVLLNTRLRRQATQPNEVNIPVQLKVLTSGKLLSSVEPRTFTDTSVALKPFSPANSRALRDGGAIVLSWQRRTRLSYLYAGPSPVVPLGEAVEVYRVRVLLGGVVLRTATVNAAFFRYTEAMQVQDGLASSSVPQFEICQLSAIAGAGYPAFIGIEALDAHDDFDAAQLECRMYDGEMFVAVRSNDLRVYVSADGAVFRHVGTHDSDRLGEFEEGAAKGDAGYAYFPKYYAYTGSGAGWYSALTPDLAKTFPPATGAYAPISGARPLCMDWDAEGHRYVRILEDKTVTTSVDGLNWDTPAPMLLPEVPGGWSWYIKMSMRLFKSGGYWYALHSAFGEQYDVGALMLMRSSDLVAWDACPGTVAHTPPKGVSSWRLWSVFAVAAKDGVLVITASGARHGSAGELLGTKQLMLRSTDGFNFEIVYEQPHINTSGQIDFGEIKPVGEGGFVASGRGGVLVSTDAGLTWTRRAMDPPPKQMRSSGQVVVASRATGSGGASECWYTKNGAMWRRSSAQEGSVL